MAAGSITLPNGDFTPSQTFSQDGHTVDAEQVVLCDASGNVVTSLAAAHDGTERGLAVRPTISDAETTGTVTANAQTVTATVPPGFQGVSVGLTGTFTGSSVIQFEGSVDGGTTYFSVPLNDRTSTTPAVATSIVGAIQAFQYGVGYVGGLTHFRCRCSAFQASDSIGVRIRVGASIPATNSVNTEFLGTGQPNEGMTNPSAGVQVTSLGATLNGAGTWDRQRGNLDGTALASAARTTTTNSSDIVNYNARGVICYLNVTSITATPLLQLNVQGKDPVSSTYYKIAADPTAAGATGIFVYEFYPGASTAAAGGTTVRTACSLPRVWRVIVTVGDTDSATYSVGYTMIV